MEQLFDVLKRLQGAFDGAGIPYRVVGGMAAFFHVSAIDPIKARLTRDIDVAMDRAQLGLIAEAVKPFGFECRHAGGADFLVDRSQPETRSAVHFVFAGFSRPSVTEEGIPLAAVADLTIMKLTSFRLKDQVHIQDLDSVGLITPEIEERLPEELRARLHRVRASQ